VITLRVYLQHSFQLELLSKESKLVIFIVTYPVDKYINAKAFLMRKRIDAFLSPSAFSYLPPGVLTPHSFLWLRHGLAKGKDAILL